MMPRQDYAFPFRIDAGSRQAAQTNYAAHVQQMIRQVLLTAPGERVNLPEFGCGLRQLIFAPHSEALDATTKLIVFQALNRWLAGQIDVKAVKVAPPGTTTEQGELLDQSQLLILIEYVLIETQSNQRLEVRVP
jgi:phage baseplate assembly protein W